MKAKTWKEAKIHDVKVRFGECIDEFRGFDDDRRIYINTYEQIMEALEQLPDNPVGYLRVAMWRQIKRDIPLLEDIRDAFYD